MVEVLDKLVPDIPSSARMSLCESMLRRERLKPTVLAGGVAFPRCEFEGTGRIICAVGVSDAGVNFGNGEYSPVHTLFVTLYPKRRFKEFVLLLDQLVRFSQDEEKMTLLHRTPHDKTAFEVVRDEVLPWGMRDWVHSHLSLPVHGMLNRMESVVRVRHG